jgi:hypothetical protein
MPDEWGPITLKSKLRLPKDTWVSEGLVGPQKGILTNEIRKGSDYQALLTMPDIPRSWIKSTTEAFE